MTSISGKTIGVGFVGALAVAGAIALAVNHSTAGVPAGPPSDEVSVQGYRVNLAKNPDALKELAAGKDPKDVAGLEEQPAGGPTTPAPSSPAR